MKATFKGPITGVTFQAEGTPREVWQQLSFLASLPETCGHCGSTEIVPNHRNVQGKYVYFELVCRSCGHVAAVGQHDDDTNLFFRQNTKWILPPRANDEAA